MTSLKLFVLGPPRLERDGQQVALPLRRAVALLVHLAVTGQPQSRETLAALLWPESDEGEARGRLRRTLHRLGDAVEGGILIADASALRLSPDADLWVDALAFRQHAAVGLVPEAAPDGPDSGQLAHLTQAAVLYADDFLAGFTLPDSPAWDEWQFNQREDLRRTCARVLERLARVHRAQAQWEAGIGSARRWLALDPLHEPAHRALMEMYAQAGQFAAAQRQYQECARVLDADLGVSPEDETTRLYEAIRARRLTPIPDGGLPPAVAPKPHAPARHRLPPQLTPFIGRTRDLATLRQLLVDEPSCRLVTLVGPGGIGKTRLALEAAAAAIPHFSDGVFFAPLAPIDSPDHVVFALAEHLDVRFYRAGEPQQQLLDYLREQQLLLVVDNFEHLVDGAPLLTEILAAAQRVKLLVTSRERLNLSGEAVYTVGGLEVPDTPSQPTALDCDAVHLLMHRARMVRPDLEVRDNALDSIVRICRLVQGMPLAIELAAGWIEALSFGEIADEIARGFDLLEGQTRDLPARQRSVRATFDYSWARLTADEQRTFMQLSVFRGGFTRPAAEAVTGAGVRGLRALVNRSFLSPGADDRYQIHELLRQYGAERLEASGEADRTRDSHCAFVLDALHRRGADLRGGRRMEALDEIEAEFENVRAAWMWALHRSSFDAIGHSAEALQIFASARNRYEEVAQLFRLARERLKPPPGQRPSLVRARILASLVFLEMISKSGYQGVAADLEESLAIAKDYGDQREIAFSLLRIGCYQFVERRDSDQARIYFEQSLKHFRALNEPYYVAIALEWFGNCVGSAADLATHMRYSLQALDETRATGNVFAMSIILQSLGAVACLSGDYAAAERFCKEALAYFSAMRMRAGLADVIVQLSLLRLLQGDLADARSLADEAYEVAREVDNPWYISQALAVLALGAAISGDTQLGKQLGEESLATSSFFVGAVLASCSLAITCCDLSDYPAAEQHLKAALTPARDRGMTAMILWPLSVAPVVLAAEGERERAVELMGLTFSHPLSATGWLEAWPRLVALRAELRAELGPEGFAAAWERGGVLNPETVAAAL